MTLAGPSNRPGRRRARRLASIGLLTLAVAVFASANANAGGQEQLHAFLSGAKGGKATFTQRTIGPGRARPQDSSGTFAFLRPGKFRWSYEAPFAQLIVGDGRKVWVFDRDLNQVIVRNLDAAIGGSPAALLAGDNALERNFTLKDDGEGDGLEWIDARPKSADAGFSRIRIALRDGLPRAMELTDSFGATTRVDFVAFERNPPVDPALFAFVPPKGVDIVGDPQ